MTIALLFFWFELLPRFALRCELVADASVVQNATEAVSQTRLDRQMMVGPLNLIQPNLREHFAPPLATTLSETDLSCCVMEIDVGRRGNINASRLGFEKPSLDWSGED